MELLHQRLDLRFNGDALRFCGRLRARLLASPEERKVFSLDYAFCCGLFRRATCHLSSMQSPRLEKLAATRRATANNMIYGGGQTVANRLRENPPSIWKQKPPDADGKEKRPTLPSWGSSQSVEKQRALMRYFDSYDKDKSGRIEASELKALLNDMFTDGKTGIMLSDENFRTLLAGMDVDNDGTVTKSEFLSAWEAWLGRALHPVRCLLIIDVQNDFIDGTMGGPGRGDVVPVINKLRSEIDFDVVSYSMDWHPHTHCSFYETFVGSGPHPASLHPDCSDAEKAAAKAATPFSSVVLSAPNGARMEQVLWPRHCVQESWGAQNHKDLVTRPSDVVVHKGVLDTIDSYSAFFDNMKLNDTGLLGRLSGLGVTHVYLVGLTFDYCVAFSALHAAESGLVTVVVEDACSAVDPANVDLRRTMLQEAGVTVCKAADLPTVMGGCTLKDTLEAASSNSRAKGLARLIQHNPKRH